MTITNGYCTSAQVKEELGEDPSNPQLDPKLDRAVNAASRQIDAHCGRRFWQDTNVATRTYLTDDTHCVEVDDISTTTGLIVKTDDAATGTYPTTQTLGTGFLLTPSNAALLTPVWPYTGIQFINGYYTPISVYRIPGLQVTAKFGWPAVPDAVEDACIIQAVQLFKASAAVFGGIQLSDMGGVLRVRATLNPIAEALVEEFVRLQ